jgi:ribonuclease HIII
MTGQQTEVFELRAAEGRELSDALTRAGYTFRAAPPHSRFQAQGEGVTVTLYESGKLVAQGRDLAGWAGRFLSGRSPNAKKKTRDAGLPDFARAALGSDEAGKGDTFGALVVSAVAWPEGGAADIVRMGVTDSKALGDARIRVLAPAIAERLPSATRVLEPSEYNERYGEVGNVNKLLTALHVEVLAELAGQHAGTAVVVDGFSPRKPVSAALGARHPSWEFYEVARAERHPAVAAASVLARAAFVESLAGLSEHFAVDLPLGSGSPVPPALDRFLQLHGPRELAGAAKMHFKNVQQRLSRS